MVYYSDDKTEVAGNTVEADNTRIGNVHDGASFLAGNVWPPDDKTDLAAGLPTATPAGNDYFSLVGSALTWTNLDTTADGQGNVASFVPALSTSDFYQAVIKTSALTSTAWTSSSSTADFAGNAIALSTSGCTPSTSGCYSGPTGTADYTYYDDWGLQLDTKSGTGFLAPIQQ